MPLLLFFFFGWQMLYLTSSLVVLNWKLVTHFKNYRFETWDVLKGTCFYTQNHKEAHSAQLPPVSSSRSSWAPTASSAHEPCSALKRRTSGVRPRYENYPANSHEVFWTQKLSANNNGSVPFSSYEISLQINILQLQNNNFSLKWFALLSAIGVNNGLRKESC